MIQVQKEQIEEIMKLAEGCQAWPVAIKLARILEDNDKANWYADKIAEGKKRLLMKY